MQPSSQIWLKLFFLWYLANTAALLPAQEEALSQSQVPELEQRLFDLPDVRFERVKDVGEHPAFMLNVKQSLNHEQSAGSYFYQRVLLVHRGFDQLNVMNTNGYTLERRPHELTELLDANYISVEHRFFGPSTPSDRNWDFLTIQQAAGDYHHVRELLGQIYHQPWISTGISKGGETCTYYRYYFPDDVLLTVPYVAPFPIGLKDQRFYEFLDTMGTPECRKKIFDYQMAVLQNKATLVPLLKYYLKGRGATVDLIGGPEAALELFILEYPFSFWQSGKKCANVPAADSNPEVLLNHLIDSGDFWYLLDSSTENLAAHYYQHATQFGYYGYRTDRFGDLISQWTGEPSACFFPYEKDLPFDETLRKELINWLTSDAQDLIFIYGETDTWTVAQAELGDNPKVKKFILPGKHHGNARIKQADPEMAKQIMEQIQNRID
ncbi:MAG: S28 family serine protease [Pirellulaceae bacterium]|nr:S28 family serine protease [Pirellulaceae bacterium]